MKIVSLLPSATEIVYALGLGDDLIGVTDECDFPPEAVTKPVVSRSALPQGRPLSSREIDRAVRERVDDHAAALPARHRPDPARAARRDPHAGSVPGAARCPPVTSRRRSQQLGVSDTTEVVSLEPSTLDDVIAQIEVVGGLLDREARGAELAAGLRERIAKAKQTAARLPTIGRVLPGVVGAAVRGGPLDPRDGRGRGRDRPPERQGRAVPRGDPPRDPRRESRGARLHAVRLLPRGGRGEGRAGLAHPEIADTPAARNGNVFAVDATSFFSRPGPRIVDGLEILAWAVHPEAYPEPPAGSIVRLG